MQNLDAVLVEYRMSHRYLQSTIYGLKAKCCRFKFVSNRLKELPTVTIVVQPDQCIATIPSSIEIQRTRLLRALF